LAIALKFGDNLALTGNPVLAFQDLPLSLG